MLFGPLNLDYPNLKINNLSLEIDAPITHFWGENGVGKSTLLKLIINDLSQKKVSFSYIDQNYRQNWFWWLSLRQNLELALSQAEGRFYQYHKIEEIQEYESQKSWLKPLLEKEFPQIDFSKQAESEGFGLSGGQLQRVLFFRELLLNPEFLLLDEAFSALDKQVVDELIQWLLLEQKRKGFQIISIVHDRKVLDAMPGAVYNLNLSPTKDLLVSK